MEEILLEEEKNNSFTEDIKLENFMLDFEFNIQVIETEISLLRVHLRAKI